VASDRVSQILQDLRIAPDAALGPDMLRRVAEFTSADHVLWGQYAKFGDKIRIDVTLQDLKRQRNFALKAEASGENDLPRTIQQLAESAQKDLALSSDSIKELRTQSLKPSSQSVQALGDYGQGLQLSRQGKYLEAVKQFEAATERDPKFALAFAELGKTYAALGYGDKAQDAARKAMDLSDSVTPQEKLLIQAENAQATKAYGKAIESYEKLAKILPDDPDIQYTLARLYEDFGTLDKAGAYYQKLLASDKNNADALLHMGWVEIRGNNPEGSIAHLNSALTLAVQLDNQEERASILDAFGNAYAYMNKREDALNSFQQALEIKRRLGDKGGVAETLNWMAGVQQDTGKADAALKSYQEAVSLRREIGDKMGLGRSLTDLGLFKESLGKYDEALALSKEGLALLHEAGDRQNEANCLNNIGWTYLDEADYANAMTYFQQALDLRQKIGSPAFIADSFYNIGDTYTRMGQYDQATDDFLKALDLWRKAGDKRGVAFASYGLGKVFQYQGRYGAALKSQQDALNSWREVNESGVWLPQIQASYGNTLTLVGRAPEAQKNLDDALRTAREVKNDPLIAQILNFEGDRLFYSGDFAGARSWYQQASKIVAHNTDREQTLLTKFNLAKVAVMQGRSREQFSSLQSLADDADRAGLKHLAVECSLYLGQALIQAKEYPRAQQVLQRALASSDKLGLQVSLAKSNYLLAEALRLGGSAAEAPHHYAEARRILDQIAKEAQSETLLKRSDLAKAYQESAQRQNPTT
jgi:tetratricopeptide (TPR) repeat protein